MATGSRWKAKGCAARCGRASAVLFVLLSLAVASARPLTEEEAGRAASEWLRRNPRPAGTGLVPSAAPAARAVGAGTGNPLFHVVSFGDAGSLVVSADTSVTPVVAILDAGDVDESPGHPLFEILAADMAARASCASAGAVRGGLRGAANAPAASNGQGAGAAAGSRAARAEAEWESLFSAETGDSTDGAGIVSDSGAARKFAAKTVGDVRVEPLLSSRWGQSEDADGLPCANYYTPRGYACGCVALAGAQVARYWGFPDTECPRISRPCYVNGYRRTCTTKGGVYPWNLMPDTFRNLSDDQREAVGRLCYDFGVAARMDWGAEGSGSWGCLLEDAFLKLLGYASAKVYAVSRTYFGDDILRRAVFANLDAKCPVVLGIYGHEVNADGYGFVSGTPYTHLNLGWEGDGDVWYNLPTVDADSEGYRSTTLDEVVYNLFPDFDGEILSGRVLDAAGNPLPDATVTAVSGSESASATSDRHGVYAFFVEGDRTWTVRAEREDASSGKIAVYVPRSVSTTVQGETISYDTGSVGNSWGNDLVLPVEPLSPEPSDFQDAVENWALAFSTGGAADWFVTDEAGFASGDSASSPDVSGGETSWLAASGASGEGIVSFRWTASGRTGGTAWFFVDDECRIARKVASGEWTGESFRVGPGAHEFQWVFAKIGGAWDGAGRLLVDQVDWSPGTPLSPVYRFYSKGYRGHFFTLDEREMDDLSTGNPNWKYEGVAFHALEAREDGAVPVYRFYSKSYRAHFYTIDEDEMRTIRQTNPNWKYEGVACYVRPDPGVGTTPVYRFWSKAYRHHFFTTSKSERDSLIATNPNWKYEGIAFYALPADDTGRSANGANRVAAAGDAAGAAGTGLAAGTGTTGVAGKTGEAGGGGMAGLSAFSALSGNADDGVCEVAAPWTLTLRQPCPGRVLAVPDVADLGEVAVETSDAMAAPLAIFAAAAAAGADGADAAELRLALPNGVFTAQLWDGAGTLLDEREAEGAFDFTVAASGAWNWLVVLDADGEEVFSLLLRADGNPH